MTDGLGGGSHGHYLTLCSPVYGSHKHDGNGTYTVLVPAAESRRCRRCGVDPPLPGMIDARVKSTATGASATIAAALVALATVVAASSVHFFEGLTTETRFYIVVVNHESQRVSDQQF